jgi:hypothetical protein
MTKIAFLLGSGISIPAGMPSTQEITDRVLSGEGVAHYTAGNYYFGGPPYDHIGMPDEYVPRVQKFLKKLKVEIDSYYSLERRLTNYEDLSYVATQICDSETGNHDNPIVQPFIDKLLPKIETLLVGKPEEVRKEWKLHDLANEATHYIRDIVWHFLSKVPTSFESFQSLKDVCLDPHLASVYIFTLNHDTVLEQCLSQNNIRVDDGFDKPENDVRYWNPDLFEGKGSKVRLFKLHGSVNRFRFRPHGGERGSDVIGIPMSQDFWHTKDKSGHRQMALDGRPVFLAGTFNKMLQYTSGIYAELHYQMRRSLRHVQNLIGCGYGFGDKGINTMIGEWADSSDTRQIVIIHPKPEELRENARVEIRDIWEDWKRKGKLTLLPQGAEKVTWQDIKDQCKAR